jgi:hypothetical protein
MDIQNVATGVVSGLLASLVWFIGLRLVKPKIRISPMIRKAPNDGTYQIKVLNVRRSNAINVKAQLYMLQPMKADGDRFRNSTPVRLERPDLMAISGNTSRDEYDGTPVFRFSTQEDLDALAQQNPDATLAFRLLATHPFSQSTQLFKQDYTWDKITLGNYSTVRSLIGDYSGGP